MKTTVIAFVLAFSLAVLGVADTVAEVYTWTDENGVRHFSDRRPEEAKGAKPAFQQYEYDEDADRQRTQEDAREIQREVKNINQEYEAAEQEKRRQAEEAEANRPPTMEERIQDEKTKLKLKISELESLPLDHFGSQANKRKTIGYWKYRLAALEKDPKRYFSEPPPPMEVPGKDPE